MANLQINKPLWKAMLRELRRRGGGVRESGAFLLAHGEANRVVRFICYDDLDPTALDSGIIIFQGSGFVPLWNICLQDRLRVVADVHTHPGRWTDQSSSDSTHPMVSTPGHLALIVPSFALNKWQGLRGVGIFEYMGGHQWKQWTASSGRVLLTETGVTP